ncbi:MAG: hypothetical protein RBQ97_12370, partial [Acholeplasma sp.]|nr:hypothetical protein [Acholeplasma sp.]
MKKFFANLIFVITTLLAGAIIVPWNDLSQWGIPLATLTTNELYIKGGIGVLILVFSLIFLIVSIRDQSYYGEAKKSVLLVAIVPNFIIAIGYLGYTLALMWYMVFRVEFTYLTAAIFYGMVFVLINIIFLTYFVARSFSKGCGFKKVMLFLLSIEVLGGSGFSAYFLKNTTETMYPGRYASMYTFVYPAIIAVAILVYLIHLIVISSRAKKTVSETNDVEKTVK